MFRPLGSDTEQYFDVAAEVIDAVCLTRTVGCSLSHERHEDAELAVAQI
jgi:hypothetical protein